MDTIAQFRRELLSMLMTDSMMPPSLAASMLGGWSRTNLARHVAAAVLVAERALFSTRAPSVVTAPAAAATSWFRTWCSATSAASRSAAAALTASDAPFRRMATRGAITPASAASFCDGDGDGRLGGLERERGAGPTRAHIEHARCARNRWRRQSPGAEREQQPPHLHTERVRARLRRHASKRLQRCALQRRGVPSELGRRQRVR